MLRKSICERFPAERTFDRYIEVFGGAGWVLFYKDKHAPLEVYNDADGQLVNLMRCIKYHGGELQRELDGYVNSREMFEDAGAQLDVRGLTDIQRAARYFLRMKLSFGAGGADTRSAQFQPSVWHDARRQKEQAIHTAVTARICPIRLSIFRTCRTV